MGIKFNELTIENVGNWPLAIKTFFISMVLLMTVFLGYWLDIRPQLSHLRSLKLQQKTLLQEMQLKYIQASQAGAYQLQLKQIKEIFKELLQKLPTRSEVPGLLEDISKTGIDDGLTFVLFKPATEKNQGFYSELPIEISVIGNYHQLSKFVSEIEGFDRIVTLHDFVIKSVTNQDLQHFPENKTLPEQLMFTVTAKTYRYIKNDAVT